MNRIKNILMIVGLLLSIHSFSQTAGIKGIVKSTDSTTIPGAGISIKGISTNNLSYNKNSSCDKKGEFKLMDVPAGSYRLVASCIGYKTIIKEINIKENETVKLHLILEEKVNELAGVEVTAKSTAQEIKESPQTVTVIEAKQLYAQSSGSGEIINKASGVKVRQDGGLGSNANFSINGISGRQVRFFIDGIPTDYLGKGLGINVLPVSLIDRIEIYKGVVPIDLGADALGGAINIVTRKNIGNYLDASYSAGSFNTQRASLNLRYLSDSSHFFAGLNGFYNHSDNNYFVDVEIPDKFGTPRDTIVRRFHDAYKNYSGAAEIGMINTKWTDLFSITAGYSGMTKNIQHDAVMSQPYGKVTYGENTFNTGLKFQKKNLFKNFDLNFYSGYNRINSLFVDTSYSVYTWDGKIVAKRPVGGEVSGSRNLLYFNTDNAIGRLNMNYKINETTGINANIITTYYERKGHDTIAEKYYGQDYFKRPTSMLKNVSGIAFQKKLFKEKLTGITSVKHYYYKANGYEINNYQKQVDTIQVQSKLGFNQAFRFQFNDKFLIRASYEYATRLPDEYEVFGDFTTLKPNPYIQPETSHNINAGALYKGKKFAFELNGFYRSTDNIIFLRTSRFFSQYQNLLKAEIRGVEGEVSYKPLEIIALSVNATFQDIRNKSPKEKSGVVDNRYYNARMPNIPYLFGNAEIRLIKEKLLKKSNTLQLWWNISYVREFYLYWAIDGIKDTKATIPSQWVQNAGISYSFFKNSFTVSMETFNPADIKTFDNYSVQKPGRSFSCKLRYFISKH